MSRWFPLTPVPFIRARDRAVAISRGDARLFPMSTIVEIEAAIELLSPLQVEELATWLNSFCARAGKTGLGRCLAETGAGSCASRRDLGGGAGPYAP